MKDGKVTPDMRHDVSMALDYERYLEGHPEQIDMVELHNWLTQWGGKPDVEEIFRRFRNAIPKDRAETKKPNRMHEAQMKIARKHEREQLKMRLEFQSKYDAMKDIGAAQEYLVMLANDYRGRGLSQDNVCSVMGLKRKQRVKLGIK